MNKAMLSEGLAWHYKDYSTSKEYSQLEDTAKLVMSLILPEDPIFAFGGNYCVNSSLLI